MRLFLFLIFILLWVAFLAFFVPGSLYSGTVIGALIALVLMAWVKRLRQRGNKPD